MSPAQSSARTLLVFSLLLTTGWTLRPIAESADFRGLAWGATKAEVKKSEDLPMHHDIEGEIAYWNFKLAGVSAGLIYNFEKGRMTRAYYTSRHRTADPEEDYADYQAFQRHFDNELGAHLEESWVWADGVKPGEENLEAITSGRAMLVTRWPANGNRVKLELVGEDGVMQTLRVYFEPE